MSGPILHSSLHRRRHSRAPDCVILLQSLDFGAVAQLGEHRLCKPGVVGSSPIRSIALRDCGLAAVLSPSRAEWSVRISVNFTDLQPPAPQPPR